MQEELLAAQLELLDVLRLMYLQVNGSGRTVPEPLRVPRPGDSAGPTNTVGWAELGRMISPRR
jgi:hypothetical protein